MIKDLDLIKNPDYFENKNFIIYGCGGSGRRIMHVMELAGCSIKGFADSNKRGDCQGYPMYHIDDLCSVIGEDCIIVVASVFYYEIIPNLEKKVDPEKIFTEFSFLLSLMLNKDRLACAEKAEFNMYYNSMMKEHHQYVVDYNIKEGLNCYYDLSHNAVMVYQCGKVGSEALTKSIINCGLRASHCHTLALPYSCMKEWGSTWDDNVKRTALGFNGKIITAIREPISRDVSEYFQSLCARGEELKEVFKITDLFDGFYDVFYYPYQKSGQDNNDFFIAQNKGFHIGSPKGYEFDWFDFELKENFGFDAYEHEFDKDRGYSIYKHLGMEIMIFQLEKINSLESIIGEFLGAENFKMCRTNDNASKPYRYMYKSFKEDFVLKKEYADLYYKNNPWFEHFYSSRDIEQFYGEWDKYIVG